jgi:hypothetical protein
LKDGKSSGIATGDAEGYNAAYPAAFAAAYDDGVVEGTLEGTAVGSREGFDAGWDLSFDEGRSIGFDMGVETFVSGAPIPNWAKQTISRPIFAVASARSTGVPEPSSLALGSMTLAGLVSVARRRRR